MLAVVMITIAFSACHQTTSSLALYIPKDAAVVLEIDTKTVTDKIKSSGISMDSLMNMFNKNGNGVQWSDIQNSGVDLTKPFFVFSSTINSIQNGLTESSGVIAPLSARGQFESLLQKNFKLVKTKADTRYQYFDLNDGSVVGWSNDVIIISSVRINKIDKADEALSHQQLTTLFNQTKSNSVSSIDAFNDMLNKTGDVHFWSNVSGNLNNLPMASATRIGDLFKDTYTEGTIDFENGRSVANFETHLNPTLSDILKKYPAKEVDKNMIANYPNPVNGFAVFAFDPRVLIDVLHYLGFDVMIDRYASNLGFTTADITKSFSGDVAILFSNFNMNSNSTPVQGMPATSSQYLINLKIDTASFNKILNGLSNKGIVIRDGNKIQLVNNGGHNFVMETISSSLIITSDSTLAATYAMGNNKNGLPNGAEKEMDNKSMVGYVDIASLLQRTNSADTGVIKVSQAAQATFKNFFTTIDKSDGKTVTSHYELNTVNPNENSLATLVKFAAVVNQAGKLKYPGGFRRYPSLSGLKDSMQNQNIPKVDSGKNNQ